MKTNSFVVVPKYPLNSFVEYETINNKVEVGKIIAIKVYKSAAFKPECYSLTYIIMPSRFINIECDDEITIEECHTTCLPRILCTYKGG